MNKGIMLTASEHYAAPSSRRKGIQLAYPLEEKRLLKWTPPYFCQPKLDGERCRVLWLNDAPILLSSEENIILSVPHINEQLQKLIPPQMRFELDGELYCHGMDFNSIHSRVSRKVEMHSDAGQIEFHLFDIVDEQLNQTERFTRLLNLWMEVFSKDHYGLKFVKFETASSMEEVMSKLHAFSNLGYEGIIVRHQHAPYKRARSTWMMKFKPKAEDTYLIIDTYEGTGQFIGSLGGLHVIGTNGQTFGVGSGFTSDERQHYWGIRDVLPGRTCRVKYQHLTPRGVPRHPIIVEVL